ncbi:hypothetical protein AT728_31230 [Streptomyces silvensis]|uniref:Uncharacterized protein n=1 Tax=Streptomyces silvensis TaxID=1765722 RepID=A0A0W7XBQ9_9ACTN|nr:hypothetical protein [Streptomyces silvensis]KUF20224.1 hypothetical protein AT728_31230 [Streptomyces silvensis]
MVEGNPVTANGAAGKRHSAECVGEAEETVEQLRAALRGAGITLPSLRVDPLMIGREAPCPLVELGRCSVETAARLAVLLPGRGEGQW